MQTHISLRTHEQRMEALEVLYTRASVAEALQIIDLATQLELAHFEHNAVYGVAKAKSPDHEA